MSPPAALSDALPVPAPSAPAIPRSVRTHPWIAPLAVLALLLAALVLLRHQLGDISYHQVARALRSIGMKQAAAALLCTAVAYLVLSGYDLLALRYAGTKFGVRRGVLASMISYGLSQTLGFPLITGGAVRLRLWSGWGMSAPQIVKATAFISMTFVVGILSVLGCALLLESDAMLLLLRVPPAYGHSAGAFSLALVVAYVAWAAAPHRIPIVIGRWRPTVPTVRFAVAQVLLALVDWSVAALVLWVLLPAPHGVALLPFIGVFVLAQFAGILSQVPGGVGVFETCMMLALRTAVPPDRAFAALLAYRVIYYLVPLALASITLVAMELARHQRYPDMVGAARGLATGALRSGAALQPLLPTALSISTFAGGAMLLFSGATPAQQGRMRLLDSLMPLGVVELSHFAASLAGIGLLVLAYALHRRLDAAWGMTLAVLGVGIVSSLFKGLDWEEATVLAGLALVLLPSRRVFYRQAALTSQPLSPEWITAVVAVVGASIWLGLFAYRHVEYSGELWWHFAARGNAPRFLRASTGAVAVIIAIGLWRLLRTATHDPAPPSANDLNQVAAIVRTSANSAPALALLGDKSLMFSESGKSFVMYGVSGRSWISLGDPVGKPEEAEELAWRFKDDADAHGAWPVFYEVGANMLPLYIDLGLSLLKVGEEAIVHLDTFALDRPAARWMRRALKDAEKAGMTFEVVPTEGVPALLPELRRISDSWLSGKSTREKGFSMGRFDETYLRHFPMAIVRVTNEHGEHPIAAFTNVWCGAPGGEVSPDLMRSGSHAPRGAMDYLFIQLLVWGKGQGYTRANLGMAPLSGLAAHRQAHPRVAPLWSRAGSFVYGRGEHFYNFQGLRTFKSKFSPEWEPRYLACPSGIVLPRVLTNVASLIAGGVTDIVRK